MKRCLSKIAISIFTIASISFAFTGCSSDSKKAKELFGQNGNGASQDTSAIGIRVGKVKDIFANLPSTVQIMQMLKAAGAKYTFEIPSDPTVVSKYSTVKGQALNLGIYAADLSYAGLFDQKNDASLYLQSANKLATSLGIPDAFNEKIISKIEANMTNQDSLLIIIVNDFWTTDTYLKKNERQEVSAYLVSGGWVEGLYIATQIAAKSSNNTGIANEIAYQKFTLQDLADMLKTYPNSANIQEISAKIKKIQDVYAGIQVEHKADQSSAGAQPEKAILSADQLKAITDAVTALRNEIIQGS